MINHFFSVINQTSLHVILVNVLTYPKDAMKSLIVMITVMKIFVAELVIMEKHIATRFLPRIQIKKVELM